MRLPPFRLPSPFTTATQAPYSLLIKPTVGSFLVDYHNGHDLHVGWSDSQGHVYEFSEGGVQCVQRSEWTQCLSVPLSSIISGLQHGSAGLLPEGSSTDDTLYRQHWDSVLQHSLTQPQWQMQQYLENTHNCYTYVLSVVKDLEMKGGRESSHSLFNKSDMFCREFIVPRTGQAARYIALYRQVKLDGVSVEST